MSIDAVGNFLTSIRNAVARAHNSVEVPYSKLKYGIAEVLLNEGFISSFNIINAEDITKKKLLLKLKYVDNESVIHVIDQMSKPGRRVYVSAQNIPIVIGGLGIAILTTSFGIITNKKAREKNIGGELICTVW